MTANGRRKMKKFKEELPNLLQESVGMEEHPFIKGEEIECKREHSLPLLIKHNNFIFTGRLRRKTYATNPPTEILSYTSFVAIKDHQLMEHYEELAPKYECGKPTLLKENELDEWEYISNILNSETENN